MPAKPLYDEPTALVLCRECTAMRSESIPQCALCGATATDPADECAHCGAPLAPGADADQVERHAYWDNGRPFCGPACAEFARRGIPSGTERRPGTQPSSARDLLDGGTVRVATPEAL